MKTPYQIVKDIIGKNYRYDNPYGINTRFYKMSKRKCPECGTPYVKSNDSEAQKFNEWTCYNCNRPMLGA